MISFVTFLKTPLWVWGILGYLIFVGVRAMKTRVVPVMQLCVIPAIFLLMRSRIFFAGSASEIVTYVTAMLLGAFAGFVWAQCTPIRIFKQAQQVEIPGSKRTLVLFLGFFAIKYCFGVLQVLNPVAAAQYALLELALSAAFSGLPSGTSLSYLYRFSRA